MDPYSNINSDPEDVPVGDTVATLDNDELPPGHVVSGLGSAAALPDHSTVPPISHYPHQSSGLSPEDAKDDFFVESEAEIQFIPDDQLSDEENNCDFNKSINNDDKSNKSNSTKTDDDVMHGDEEDGKSVPATKSFEVSDNGSDEESANGGGMEEDAKPATPPSACCKTRRRKVLIVLAVVVALLGGGAAAVYYFYGIPAIGPSDKSAEEPAQAPASQEPSASPTMAPSSSQSPSAEPSTSRIPSMQPSAIPTQLPSTAHPTLSPTIDCARFQPIQLVYNFTQSDFAKAADSLNGVVTQQKRSGAFPLEALNCNMRISEISAIESMGDFGGSNERFSLKLKEASWFGVIVTAGGTSECGKETTAPVADSFLLPNLAQQWQRLSFTAVLNITESVGINICESPSFLNFAIVVDFVP